MTEEQKQNAYDLAVFIRKSKTYYQGLFFNIPALFDEGCGTPACVCGHGAALWDLSRKSPRMENEVAKRLGLSLDERERMFDASPIFLDQSHDWSGAHIVTKEEAAQMLERYALTGAVT